MAWSGPRRRHAIRRERSWRLLAEQIQGFLEPRQLLGHLCLRTVGVQDEQVFVALLDEHAGCRPSSTRGPRRSAGLLVAGSERLGTPSAIVVTADDLAGDRLRAPRVHRWLSRGRRRRRLGGRRHLLGRLRSRARALAQGGSFGMRWVDDGRFGRTGSAGDPDHRAPSYAPATTKSRIPRDSRCRPGAGVVRRTLRIGDLEAVVTGQARP